MDSEIGEFIGQKNTLIANKTQSIVRESSVITKTVVRKKRMIINGEVVEIEEEEKETEPNIRQFASQSQSLYADDVFQGKCFRNSHVFVLCLYHHNLENKRT